ncbi:MAG: GNAT family N-acetyltransferase [Spirochaetales bacterium]|nr:GNAT family N-acetyltransferase [Spirochaetales bacterium]
MSYKLIRTDGSHPGFLSLIRALDKELRSHDADAEHEQLYISQNIVTDDVPVSLVILDEEAVGCACLRAYEESDFELKRMYVLPEHRGRGLSRRILRDLEVWAEELGRKRVILETGAVLKAAVSLYKSEGYRVIENYGHYKDIPESICFAKELGEENH